ncbi:MAG: hypothetical protein S4CHLAM2_09490 [Chlamydiales bacterium]|nr:hypothetical protein [Chlamydiales bacterium]
MSSGAGRAGDAHHDKLVHEEGFEQKGSKSVTFAGTRYTQTTYKKHENQGKLARAGRAAVAVAAAIPPLTVAYASKGFRTSAEAGLKGEVKRTALYDPVDPLEAERPLVGDPETADEQKLVTQYRANRLEIADGLGDDYENYEDYVADLGYDPASPLIQRLGYDPKNRASIRAYLERPEIRRELLESNGNYMLPEHRNANLGISSFLFVPNGRFEEATSIKIHDAKTGQPLKGKEFTRAMYSYSSQHVDLMKGIDEKADKWADKLIANHPSLSKEKAKEIVKKSLREGIIVLDFKGGHTRLYPRDLDPNKYSDLTGFFGSMKGTRISWSKGTTEDVKEFHKATPKRELPTHKPFEHAPPPPSADGAADDAADQ